MARLPPPEAQPADLIQYADDLEDECIRDPNRIAWDNNKQRWMDLYTGNHFASPLSSAANLEPELRSNRAASAVCKLVYNRVMNAILAMLAGQVSNPPKVVFGARENGEPPIYYLNGFVEHPMLDQIAMMAGASDPDVQEMDETYGRTPVEVQPEATDPSLPPEQPRIELQMHPETASAAIQAGKSTPLPSELAMQVKALIDQGKMMTAQARLAGMPPPLGIVPPEALVEITDQTTAQFTQTIFDGLWEQCGGIEAATENVLNKKVLGWQPTLFESDREKIAYGESPITLTNVEGTQVYFDPMTSSYRKPRYVIMVEPVSYEEGIAKYPDLADKLSEKATNNGTLGGRRNRTVDGRLFNLQYSRDMCVVRTLWIRDWAYPMDPDEAMHCGKVQVAQLPVAVEPGMVEVDANGVPLPPAMRQAFISAETGEEVIPGGPGWPIIYGIREIRDIEGELVFDQRCKLPTIPVCNNINIPIPFSPYGFGEPDRLDGLQMAINRVLSDLVTHHRYTAYPPEVVHEVVAGAQGSALRKARTRPDTRIVATTEAAQAVGGDLKNLLSYIDVPQMGADAWKLLEFLVEAIDKEANNTDVQQGEAPAGSSGAWVANLQAAANQVAQVTSQATEAWLKQVVRLFVHFIARDMTDQDVMKYTAKYPPAIVEAFRRKQKSLYLDIAVEIQSGTGAAKQAKTNAMIMARQGGITVAEPDILDGLNIDPDATLKREAEWLQKKTDSGLIDQQAEQQVSGKEKQPVGNESG